MFGDVRLGTLTGSIAQQVTASGAGVRVNPPQNRPRCSNNCCAATRAADSSSATEQLRSRIEAERCSPTRLRRRDAEAAGADGAHQQAAQLFRAVLRKRVAYALRADVTATALVRRPPVTEQPQTARIDLAPNDHLGQLQE